MIDDHPPTYREYALPGYWGCRVDNGDIVRIDAIQEVYIYRTNGAPDKPVEVLGQVRLSYEGFPVNINHSANVTIRVPGDFVDVILLTPLEQVKCPS